MLAIFVDKMRSQHIFLIILFLISTSGYSQLVSDFEIDKRNNCASSKVYFFNTSSYSGSVTYKWNFGNGYSFQNLDTIEHLYTNAGIYYVSLLLTNGTDTSITTKEINIYEKPKAKFEIENGKGCGIVLAEFVDLSEQGSAPISEWHWDLRNGEMLLGQEAQYEYTEIGSYDVLLKVEDTNNCASFYELKSEIEVFEEISAEFAVDKQYWCYPTSFRFTPEIGYSSNNTYNWYIDDEFVTNSYSPSIFLDSEGVYDATLSISNIHGCYDSIVKSQLITIDTINVDFDIIADIAIEDYDTICPGNALLSNTSSGGNDYKWYVNGAFIDNSFDLEHEFYEPGFYFIELRIGSESCEKSLTRYLYVDNIKANFIIEDEFACSVPKTFSFINASNNGETFLWKFPDASTSTDIHSSYTVNEIEDTLDYIRTEYIYKVPISLVATNSRGCSSSIEKNVEFTIPTARFMVDQKRGCVPLEVNFYDRSNSSINIKNYKWIYTSEDEEIVEDVNYSSYIYDNAGTYEAYLIIENDSGCVDTSQFIQIHVGDVLNPDFDISKDKVCNGDSIFLLNTTEKPELINYTYFYSDGLFSVKSENNISAIVHFDPPNTGFYDITMQVNSNGCDSEIRKIDILEVEGPIVTFEAVTNCTDPYKYYFNSTMQQSDTWNWDFADGNFSTEVDPQHRFNDQNEYLIKLYAENISNSCKDTAEITIKVQKPEVLFTTDPDTFACVANLPYSENDIISAEISHSSGVADYCDAEPFLWNFGNSNSWTRSDAYASYSYTSKGDGIENITVIAEDNKGCKDTLSIEYDIIEPQVDFIIDTSTICHPGFSVLFTDLEIDGTVAESYWIFDDGDTAYNETSISHYYENNYQRYFNPSLTVIDSFGCDIRLSQVISYVKPNPYFYVSKSIPVTEKITGACINELIYFQSTPYYITDSNIWKIGDEHINESLISKVFDQWGNYEIKHIAYNKGCKDSSSTIFEIEEANATFEVYDTVQECNLLLKFLHESNSATIIENESFWTFDDEGHTGNYKNDTVYFAYTKPGIHFPTLNITTKYNCKDKDSTEIEIFRPWAEVSYSDGIVCSNEEVLIQIDTLQYWTDYYWILGDNSIIRSDSFWYTFDTLPIFLSLHIENDSLPGCAFDQNYYFDVKNIKADFSTSIVDGEICDNVYTSIQNNSEGHNFSSWYLNNNLISISNSFNGLYFQQSGTNKLRLIARNEFNCSDTSEIYVNVFPSPDAGFLSNVDNSMMCVDDILHLQDSSDGADKLFWFFNDSLFSNNENPEDISLLAPMQVTIELKTINNFNCRDSAFQFFNIYSRPIADFELDITNNELCINENMVVINNSIDASRNSWFLNDELFSHNQNISSVPFTLEGLNNLKLIVSNIYTCSDSVSKDINILAAPTSNFTTNIANENMCVNDNLELENQSEGANYFYWYFNDSMFSISRDFIDTVLTEAEDVILSLIAENELGCYDTIFEYFRVNETPIANFETNLNDSYLCLNNDLLIENQSIGAFYYQWFLNNNLYSETNTDFQISPEAGEYVLKLITSNLFNCFDSTEIDFSIKPLPEVNILGDYLFCEGSSSTQIEAITNSNENTINWEPSDFVSNPNILEPFINIPYSSYLHVTAISPFNCENYDSTLVELVNYPYISRRPQRIDTVIYPGAFLEFFVLSSNESEYSWSPSQFVQFPENNNTEVYPQDSVVFTVKIKDICFETEEKFIVSVHEESKLDMPKAFMPLGEGINSKVFVKGNGIIELIDFKVFNRWGNLVYSSDDINRGWDGYFKGKLLPSDTYAYTIIAKDYRGIEHKVKGTILLLH